MRAKATAVRARGARGAREVNRKEMGRLRRGGRCREHCENLKNPEEKVDDVRRRRAA